MTKVRFQIDEENNGEEWWDALRSPERSAELKGLREALEFCDQFEVEEEAARRLLAAAKSLPGWYGGPSHAPHPLHLSEVQEASPLHPEAGPYGGGLSLRASLRQQLALTGEMALEMLQGSAPRDEAILWASAEAVGLLDDVTCGARLRDLRVRLLRALMQARDWTPEFAFPWSSGPEARERDLHRALALAGVASVAPASAGALSQSLIEATTEVDLHPAMFAALSSLAGTWLDALDLAEDHPATVLLSAVARAEKRAQATISDEAWNEAVGHVEARLFGREEE